MPAVKLVVRCVNAIGLGVGLSRRRAAAALPRRDCSCNVLPSANGKRWSQVKLYSAPLSLFARKVEIALREKSLPFDRVMVPFTQAAGYAPKHPDVLATNPKGQVPVLVDGDLTLFDSTLILEYLEDAYPTPPLYPAGAKARARCRLIELSADEILLPLVRNLMFRNAPPDPDPERQRLRESEGERAEAAISAYYGGLGATLRDPPHVF